MSEKMMSRNDIWIKYRKWLDTDIVSQSIVDPDLDKDREAFLDWCESLVKDARLGTIPAEGAIAVPPVEKWDSETTELAVYACDQHGCQQFYLGTFPRPVPEWTQFTKDDYKMFLGKIVRTKTNTFIGAIDCVSGDKVQIGRAMEESFDTLFECYEFEDGSPCGKPWEEI